MSVFFHVRICSGITAEVRRFDCMICSVGASGSGAVLFWLAGFRVQLTGMGWGRPLCRRALAMPSCLWGGEAGPLQQLKCKVSFWLLVNGFHAMVTAKTSKWKFEVLFIQPFLINGNTRIQRDLGLCASTCLTGEGLHAMVAQVQLQLD